MTFDPPEPVQTRDGRKARIVCTDVNGHYPIIALVDYHGTELVHHFNADGKACTGSRGSDLINIPVKREGWINIYPLGSCEGIFPTETIATVESGHSRIACIRIKYTDGEGLS